MHSWRHELVFVQVFAYGQTGAGKTYTMGTALSAKQVQSAQEESLIPAALRLVFESLAAMRQEYAITLKVSPKVNPACYFFSIALWQQRRTKLPSY